MAAKKRLLDDEIQKALIEYADTNCSLGEISRKYNIGRDGFTKILIDLDIPLNSEPIIKTRYVESDYTKKFREKDDAVIDYYISSGKSIDEVAKEKHICSKRLSKLLKNRNIAFNDSRKIYNLNENYFDIIGSDQAYWLGFIMGDGCITNNTFKVCLSETDLSHLKLLASDLSWDGPLEYNASNNSKGFENSKPTYTLVIHRVSLCKKLNELGIESNKSCNEKFLNFESDNLKYDFIRGLFDADGWISTYTDSKKVNKAEWGICSSKEMCSSIKTFLESKNIKCGRITKNNTKKENNLYRIRISNIDEIRKLYKLLYRDNSKSLMRKTEKLKNL